MNTELFSEHRPMLFGVAYRMLGSVMEAEDILQDACVSWLEQDTAAIQNPAGFLRTIVTRRCIDLLRSARAQREVYPGTWLPEPLVADPELSSAEHMLEIKDDLSAAFLIVLEALSPVERAVYLMRECFDVPFEEIADVVEKTPENCRQILHRARQAVADRRRKHAVPGADQGRRLLEAFLSACRSGEVGAFVNILADDVSVSTDGGGKVNAARNVILGLNNAAKFFVGVYALQPPAVSGEPATINGCPGVILRTHGRVYCALWFETDGEKISAVYSMLNPDKLRHLN